MSEKFKKALRIAVNVGCGFEGDSEDAAELLTLIVGLESRITELEAVVDKLIWSVEGRVEFMYSKHQREFEDIVAEYKEREE